MSEPWRPWFEKEAGETPQFWRGAISRSQNPSPPATISSLLPGSFLLSIDDDTPESGNTEFYTPPASAAGAYGVFANQLDGQAMMTSPEGLTARLPVAQSWHRTSEVDLDQIIVERIGEDWWRCKQAPRQDTLFAPISPNASEAPTQALELASPFDWANSKTVCWLDQPHRHDCRIMKQDWQKLEGGDEMCGYRRTRAASWALNSVVISGPESLIRFGGQMAQRECEGELSLRDRIVSWLRALMKREILAVQSDPGVARRE
ncbi:hypothetical protein AYL99_06115 [Fonsecaea erecta]|uniref:Uncharacterized protein n=1 Tax=Fonsecaea erecta TaxID=1367422 RepID=A0A178ZGB5_9EURO|nr:hypothetical protein AYL99_06115 [Fonsecaea erecta]OAP58818.1 hypothetical protein AYL99_06115 [Fonsecaea erecta]